MKVIDSKIEIISSKEEIIRGFQLIETAARNCYKSEDLTNDSNNLHFVFNLYKRGHESPLEFMNLIFRVICDRGVSHEFVRHRLASYAQESTRFCNYSKDKFNNEITVINNEELKGELYEEWYKSCLYLEQSYLYLINNGVSPQVARSVLPNSLKTEIVVNMNFRELLHFLKLRSSPKAHPDIRRISLMIMDSLSDLNLGFLLFFKDFIDIKELCNE